MKTHVKIIGEDHFYDKYKEGQVGIIDGYVLGYNGTPVAIVIIEHRFVLVQIHHLEYLGS